MGLLQALSSFIKDRRGVTVAAFAIVIPVVLVATGVAIDMSRAYMVKQRLGQSLDAAALATAGSSLTEDELQDRMERFFYINFEDGNIGEVQSLDWNPQPQEIKIWATVRVPTTFMQIWGHTHLDIYAETTVQKELQGIEVALVMDNTGSMGSYNNIAALRTAATNFVNIMFDRAPDPEVIKIGLVPYSTSVNVGRYGLGQNPDGTQYADGIPFVNNPHGLSYTTNYNSNNGWLGCVIEDEPNDITDHEGPWDMYRYCRDADDDPYCHLNWQGNVRQRPNYVCPTSYVTPLTSNQSYLTSRISTMNARGHTLGNYGMVWGWRIISPDFPFEEGAPYDDPLWRKAVIMMTDGQNTMHPYYSAYGPTQDHSINASDLNYKFEDVCEAMKDDGIIIYTVTFTSSINETTKDYYRDCATDVTKYYDAPSQADLIEAFEAISRELSNLYIKK
jgi:Flp pilus assembly protein TadG